MSPTQHRASPRAHASFPGEDLLIARSRDGSEDAFSQLVLLHHQRVRGYLGGWLRRPDVVDDLAQEVFLTAFRHFGSFDQRRPLVLWLLGIARHRALAYLRAELRRHQREGPSSKLALARRALGELERSDDTEARERELAALQACLAALSHGSARLVTAHYLEGQSAVAMARALGKTDGAIRMALLRMRDALRACIEKRLAREAGG